MTANPTLSYVHGMAPMIEINEDATVSRTIMKAETCRVVLFSFDKDQALSEHTAAMPAVVQVLEGRLRIDADGQSVELVPGDILHFGPRPGTQQDAAADAWPQREGRQEGEVTSGQKSAWSCSSPGVSSGDQNRSESVKPEITEMNAAGCSTHG